MDARHIADFRQLIALWPSARAFARDIASEAQQEQGRIWNRRNRVPKEYWPRLITAATKLGVRRLTMEHLDRLHKAGKGEGR